MNILLLSDYPFHQSGLSVLGETCYKGLTFLGHNVHNCSLFNSQEIENLCKTVKYDVVLGIGYWNDACRQIEIPKKYGQKVALWWVSEANVAKYQDLIPKADLLLTTSDYSTEIFKKYVPESKPKTLYIGTDTDFYKPNDKPNNNLKPIFSTFVSSGEIKGVEEALTSVLFLSKKNLNYTYVVHSPFTSEYKLENDYMKKLETLSKKYNLTKWVSLARGIKFPKENMPSVYKTMYAYLAPLRMACFGIPLIEAGACGCPSITGDWKPMNEIVKNGVTGITVPHMAKAIVPKFQERVWYTEEYRMIDTNILADKIEDLICNPEKRNKMGEAARKHVVENFNSKIQIKKLEGELLKL